MNAALNSKAPPVVDHTEFMIKPPALDIRVEPSLNQRATFLAQLEPPSGTVNHAVFTLALPDMKGSIVLDTTLLASKKDVPPDKQLFLPKDESAVMRWIAVGLNDVLQNARKFGLPPLKDMVCSRDMNALKIKVNGTEKMFRLITRANVPPLVKFLNDLYAPGSPHLATDEPEVAPAAPVQPVVIAEPAPVVEPPAPVIAIAPVPAPTAAVPTVVPPAIVAMAPAPVETAAPAEADPIVFLKLETGMLFLSKSGSGRSRTVEMIGGFANLYEKEAEGTWAHQREFDPTELEVLVEWLYSNCDLQTERADMQAVAAARPAA